MPEFPKREQEIFPLAFRMVNGFINHLADFPSITPDDVFLLINTSQGYKAARDISHQAQAALKLATRNKSAGLKALADLMKSLLKRSEVDTAAAPEKLTEIGWGPKAAPQPIEAPGQPRNLQARSQGQGTCRLVWQSPAAGGAVRNYIIQRNQQPAGGGAPGEWEIVGTALNNQINLTDQPRGIQMNYRVMAANVAGESAPSNIAPVVL